jgi:hypothetical protein
MFNYEMELNTAKDEYQFPFFLFFIKFLYNKSQKNNIQLFYLKLIESFRGKTNLLTALDRKFKNNISLNTFKSKKNILRIKCEKENKNVTIEFEGVFYIDNYVLVHIKKYHVLKSSQINKENNQTSQDNGRCTAILYNKSSKIRSNDNIIIKTSNIFSIADIVTKKNGQSIALKLLKLFKNSNLYIIKKKYKFLTTPFKINPSEVEDKYVTSSNNVIPYDLLKLDITKKEDSFKIFDRLFKNLKKTNFYVMDVAVYNFYLQYQIENNNNKAISFLALRHSGKYSLEMIYSEYFEFFTGELYMIIFQTNYAVKKPKFYVLEQFWNILYIATLNILKKIKDQNNRFINQEIQNIEFYNDFIFILTDVSLNRERKIISQLK